MWNEVARSYAEHVHPVTALYVEDALRLASPAPDERVLDVACGAGAVAFPAAAKGNEVLAIDVAQAFVDMVQKRARAEGLHNLTAKVMDGQALRVPDASFDVVLSNFGAFLFPDRSRGFREMWRVLRPGGRAVVTSFVGPPENEWMALFGQAARETFPDLAAPSPRFLELADADRFARELREAGFADVQVEGIRQEATWPDAEAAWVALSEGAPVFRPILERVGPEGARRMQEAFTALAEARFGEGAVVLGAPAHCAVARKGT